jgi:hypothetical protein
MDAAADPSISHQEATKLALNILKQPASAISQQLRAFIAQTALYLPVQEPVK